MKARVVKDLHYSRYLKIILSNFTRLKAGSILREFLNIACSVYP